MQLYQFSIYDTYDHNRSQAAELITRGRFSQSQPPVYKVSSRGYLHHAYVAEYRTCALRPRLSRSAQSALT